MDPERATLRRRVKLASPLHMHGPTAVRCDGPAHGRPHEARHMRQERESSVYAIVRCGGRQEKASVDEVLTVDTLDGEAGSSVNLPALLVVDDDKVISDPAEL